MYQTTPKSCQKCRREFLLVQKAGPPRILCYTCSPLTKDCAKRLRSAGQPTPVDLQLSNGFGQFIVSITHPFLQLSAT